MPGLFSDEPGGDSPLEKADIVAVTSASLLRKFIKLPWKIYRGDPFWVPPLIVDMKKMLDRTKHPFFQHSSAELFLAMRQGKVVGRIAAILNNNHNRYHNEKTAFFGFFESIDNQEIASALLDRAAQWARDRGMRQLLGPMNYSTNETVGILIEGFDSHPCVMMPHNPPYYPALIENAGFGKAMDLYAWWMMAEKGLNPKILRVGGMVVKDEEICVRSIDMNNFWGDVEILKRIYNDAWSSNWGFVPMTAAEFRHMAKELKTIVDPRVVLIAEKRGEPVAFSIVLPDFNQALAKINGRLLPFGLLKLMYYGRRIRRVRVLALGIAKKMQNWSGIGSALYYETFHRAIAAGYTSGEFSWTLENNDLINRSMRLFGAEIYKRYRIYQRKF